MPRRGYKQTPEHKLAVSRGKRRYHAMKRRDPNAWRKSPDAAAIEAKRKAAYEATVSGKRKDPTKRGYKKSPEHIANWMKSMGYDGKTKRNGATPEKPAKRASSMTPESRARFNDGRNESRARIREFERRRRMAKARRTRQSIVWIIEEVRSLNTELLSMLDEMWTLIDERDGEAADA